MSDPVVPISGAYPPPAIIVRNDHSTARQAEPVQPASPPSPSAARMTGAQGVALAGSGWVSVLHTTQRRGLRADETERRRYRTSYARAQDMAAPAAPRLERSA